MVFPTPLPPEPETSVVLEHLREHKRLLITQDAETMFRMADRWIQLEGSLAAQISLLIQEISDLQAAGQVIHINRLLKLDRYQLLLTQLDDETAEYVEWAEGAIETYQRMFGQLGSDHATEAVQLSLKEAGFGSGEFFNRLPTDAIETMVGMTDGGPLGDLLEEAFPASADGMTQALIESVALGRPPGETARRMLDGAAEGLTRVTTIARTEQLRVYREASRQQYEESGAIQEYERLAAKQPNTCMICISLDGEIYPTSDLMNVHPNDRCTMIPIVAGVPRIEREKAGDWFAKQDPDLQKQMLGPGRFKLYEQGEINLDDLVIKMDHPIWGPSLGLTNLRDLPGGAPVVEVGPPGVPDEPAMKEGMLTGDFEYLDKDLGGVNESYKVGVGDEEAIIKPGNNHWEQEIDAEVFTNELSDELGFGIVPSTVERPAGSYLMPDGTTGDQDASVMAWIDNGVEGYDVTWEDLDERTYSQMVLMDSLTNNNDRHLGNWLTVDNKVVAIDNGIAFKATSENFFHHSTFDRGLTDWVENTTEDLLRFDASDIDAIAGLLDNEEFQDRFMEVFEPKKWTSFEYQAQVIIKNKDALVSGVDFDFMMEDL